MPIKDSVKFKPFQKRKSAGEFQIQVNFIERNKQNTLNILPSIGNSHFVENSFNQTKIRPNESLKNLSQIFINMTNKNKNTKKILI